MTKTRTVQEADRYLQDCIAAMGSVDLLVVDQVIRRLQTAREQGQVVYIAGNGGSASTAGHMAVDLSKTSARIHGRRIRTVSLTDSVSKLTAISNDISYDQVFAEQLVQVIQPDDLLILISVSGTSVNTVTAARVARQSGASVISFTGTGGGDLKPVSDICVQVDSDDFGYVEDTHMMLVHMITRVLTLDT